MVLITEFLKCIVKADSLTELLVAFLVFLFPISAKYSLKFCDIRKPRKPIAAQQALIYKP